MSRTYRRQGWERPWWLERNEIREIRRYHSDSMRPNGSGPSQLKWYYRKNRRSNEKRFLNQIRNYDIEGILYPSEKQLKYLAWVVY